MYSFNTKTSTSYHKTDSLMQFLPQNLKVVSVFLTLSCFCILFAVSSLHCDGNKTPNPLWEHSSLYIF